MGVLRRSLVNSATEVSELQQWTEASGPEALGRCNREAPPNAADTQVSGRGRARPHRGRPKVMSAVAVRHTAWYPWAAAAFKTWFAHRSAALSHFRRFSSASSSVVGPGLMLAIQHDAHGPAPAADPGYYPCLGIAPSTPGWTSTRPGAVHTQPPTGNRAIPDSARRPTRTGWGTSRIRCGQLLVDLI